MVEHPTPPRVGVTCWRWAAENRVKRSSTSFIVGGENPRPAAAAADDDIVAVVKALPSSSCSRRIVGSVKGIENVRMLKEGIVGEI